jgi:hypothetical protein
MKPNGSAGRAGLDRRQALASLAAVAAGAIWPCSALAAAPAVPFYSSRSDLESGLAAARMVLGAFEPDEHFPVADVNQMIFHRPGYWVFEAQLAPILLQKGYRVTVHGLTPYPELIQGGEAGRYGEGTAQRIDREALAWAWRHLDRNSFRREGPALEQALAWSAAGDVVMISVDRSVLRSDPALPYLRYYLVLTGVGQDLRFHDPGQGPHRAAPRELIRRAFDLPRTDRAVLRVRRNEP